MPTNEKKGVTVKIDAELHAEVRRYIEEHQMTMGEFVSMALQNELHPKLNIQEEKNMGNMRTLAFQVPEELFQKIKDYLQRNEMTQKEFVIGLIENEINRDLTQQAALSEEMPEEQSEAQKTATVSGCENVLEEIEQEYEEQENGDLEEDLETEDEVLEEEQGEIEEQCEDEIEVQDESENMTMSMGM